MPKTPRGTRVADATTDSVCVVNKAPNGEAQPYFGDDNINGGAGNDLLDGGAGFDTADGSWQTGICDDSETTQNCETVTVGAYP